MQYVIHKTDDIARMEEGRIALAPWGAEYRPDARFYIGWQDDRLIVHLRAYEVNPVADVTERNGNVCCDSCLEFFFSPSADNSAGYFNERQSDAAFALRARFEAHGALLRRLAAGGVPADRDAGQRRLLDGRRRVLAGEFHRAARYGAPLCARRVV